MAQKWAKMAQKWSKNSSKRAPRGLKVGQNDTKTTPKWGQNDAKWSLSDPKMTPGRPKKWFKLISKWLSFGPILVPQNCPEMAVDSQPQIVSKMAQKMSKVVKSGNKKTVQRSSRPSSKCMKTLQNPLRTLAGPPQPHPNPNSNPNPGGWRLAFCYFISM